MAELTCPAGHRLVAGGEPGPFCSEECEVVSEVVSEDTAATPSPGPDAPRLPPPTDQADAARTHWQVAGRFTALIGDRRIALPHGQRVPIGRALDSPAADVLACYTNVGRQHLELTATDAGVLVHPLPSINGTYVEGHALTAGQEIVLAVPVTLRMAANCFVRVEPSGE